MIVGDRRIVLGVLAALALAVAVFPSPYLIHLFILIGIYAILALSLNLITGFTGMLNLGHAAFYGIGAYASALLVLSGFPFWVGILAAAAFAGFFGLLLAVPALRLRGDYLAIATLGFGEIIRSIMLNWTDLTRGPMGLPGIPKPELFGFSFNEPITYLALVVVVALFAFFILNRLTTSPFGRVLKAIREDEIAASALGKNVNYYKTTAMIIGAAFAGIAGSMYAHYITFIDPTSFVLAETVLMLAMVILGGMASLEGAVLGAIILVLLPEPLRFIGLPSSIVGQMRQIIYSIILIVLMLKHPTGIMGKVEIFKGGKK